MKRFFIFTAFALLSGLASACPAFAVDEIPHIPWGEKIPLRRAQKIMDQLTKQTAQLVAEYAALTSENKQLTDGRIFRPIFFESVDAEKAQQTQALVLQEINTRLVAVGELEKALDRHMVGADTMVRLFEWSWDIGIVSSYVYCIYLVQALVRSGDGALAAIGIALGSIWFKAFFDFTSEHSAKKLEFDPTLAEAAVVAVALPTTVALGASVLVVGGAVVLPTHLIRRLKTKKLEKNASNFSKQVAKKLQALLPEASIEENEDTCDKVLMAAQTKLLPAPSPKP